MTGATNWHEGSVIPAQAGMTNYGKHDVVGWVQFHTLQASVAHGHFVVESGFVTGQIYSDSNSTRVLPNDVENISIENLPLLDLDGKPVILADRFDKYILLIFLRHLA